MLAYPVTQFGLDHLQLADLTTPRIAPDMVLIKVHAVSLNYRDLLVAKGLYNPKMTLPRIPCSDGAGQIVAVGEGVTRVEIGDRVCGIFMQRGLAGPPTPDNSSGPLGAPAPRLLPHHALLPQN